MITDSRNTEPGDIPEFDRVMRGLVGVDPGEIEDGPKAKVAQRIEGDRAFEEYDNGARLVSQGDYATGTVLEHSARLSPHYKTLELLGECYLELGRFCDAVVVLAASTTIHKQPRAPFLLAMAYEALDDLTKAREMAELACQRNPRFAAASELLEALSRKVQQSNNADRA